jgi:predicted RNA-binding Zn ribbon-like protein
MRLSKKYLVPSEVALLYEFVNTLDLRQYVEKGAPHFVSDELATPQNFEIWLRDRRLLNKDAGLGQHDHRDALELREGLRSFVELDIADRATETSVTERLNAAIAKFPLILEGSGSGTVELRPAPGTGALGQVLAEFHLLSQTGGLDRLKSCASDECKWVFFDRSKPGNRRWCSSALCGNRQKTRAYRRRQREDAERRQE